MNLVFSAALLLVIFAPGAIFRRSYLSGDFSRKYITTSPSDEAAYAILPAVFLQVVMILSVERYTHYSVDFRALGILLSGDTDHEALIRAFQDIHDYLLPIFLYNVILWLMSFTIGHIARLIVISCELDLKVGLLKFSNDWYYLLRGREWGLRQKRDFDLIWIDALVSKGSTETLYGGTLDNFNLARDGRLDLISLRDAVKWTSQLNDKRKLINIPGHALVIKYSDILNINISFYRLEEKTLSDNSGAEGSSRTEALNDRTP